MRRLNLQLPTANLVDAVKKPTGRRPGGSLAARVIDATVTRAHEQTRLGKPGDRTTQVGTIGGEHQERSSSRSIALPADVDPDVGRHAVPRLPDRIVESHQSRLIRREILDRAQGSHSTGRFLIPRM